MANYDSDVTKLVARCRRIGWDVETRGGKGVNHDWQYRITCPDKFRVQIHNTPTNGTAAMRDMVRLLNAHGFAEAEAAWIANDKAVKAERLQAQRRAAEADAERLARQAAAEAERQARVVKAAGPYAGPQPVDPAWLMTPTRYPETRTVLIGPDVAGKVLDTMNTHNRRPSAARVEYFENLIRDNEFGCTHQGGAIDWNGVLQDGQSRLQAIVNMNATVAMQWSIGMDPANFSRVDTGGLRTGRDTAYIMGEADPALISSATKLLLHVERYGPDAHVRSRHGRLSNDTVEKAILRYGGTLREAVAQAKEIKRDVRKGNAAAMASAIYLIRNRLPKGDPRVDEFFQNLQEGNVDRTDVVWKLRQALLNGSSTTGRPYDAWAALALTLKAWNHRHTQRNVTLLTWRPHGEAFPCHVFLPPPGSANKAATA